MCGIQVHAQNSQNIVTGRQRSCGKVMFSVTCVCLSTGGSHTGSQAQTPGHVQTWTSLYCTGISLPHFFSTCSLCILYRQLAFDWNAFFYYYVAIFTYHHSYFSIRLIFWPKMIEGGANHKGWGANPLFWSHFFPKNAWKWKMYRSVNAPGVLNGKSISVWP